MSGAFAIRFLAAVGDADDVNEDVYVCVVVYVDDIDVVIVEVVDTVA